MSAFFISFRADICCPM